MDATIHSLALAPVDSARVVSTVYSLSIVSMIPFAAAAITAVMVRRMPAGTRALAWRASVVALLVVAGAQLVPLRWEAWVLPAALADPLIALGRLAIRSSDAVGILSTQLPLSDPTPALLVSLLGAVYVAGVAVVLASGIGAIVAARRLVSSSAPLDDPAWQGACDRARRALGISRPVPLRLASDIEVPMAVGVWWPVVLIPAGLLTLPPAGRRAVLLHELAHVRSSDVAYALAAQLACAIFWFHPAAWWVARCLRRASEVACDDCVLAAGTRQSDYAILLVTVAGRLRPRAAGAIVASPQAAVSGFAGRGALRARLAAITTVGLDRRPPRRLSVVMAFAGTVALAAPLGLVQLEPTRAVLQSLMDDGRWESRAYAVLGLAPRPDSLTVTRHAAATDPSPHVRAWASYALARHAAKRDPRPAQPAH